MPMSDNARGAIYLNVAMLTFTVNDSLMKAVTETMPLFQAITLRGLLSTAALVAMALLSGAMRLPRPLPGRGPLMLRTLAEVGATVFFMAALVHMPLANLSAIMQSLPLAVTLAAALAFGERVGGAQLLAILLGFAGVLLIVRPGTEGFDRWALLGLASVGCVVVRDLATRAMPTELPSILVSVAASAAVMLTGLVASFGSGWQVVTAAEAGMLAGAAACLVVGYVFVVRMMRVGSIATIAPFRYTALLWALILGWLLFGTFPDRLTLAGAAIVVVTGIFTLYHGRQQSQTASRSAPGRPIGSPAGD